MSDKRIKIAEMHPHSLAQSLLKGHTIGSLRDQGDLDNAKYHAGVTLRVIKELMEDAEWTKEELIEYIDNNIKGLDKFELRNEQGGTGDNESTGEGA